MFKLFTRGDKILIVLILLLNSVPLLMTMAQEVQQGEKQIVIRVDGQEIERIPLKNEAKSRWIDFDFEVEQRSYQGRLEAKNGKVRLLRLPKEITPRSIHSDMGWISKENQMIVALPVKLVITVEGEKRDESIDIISY